MGCTLPEPLGYVVLLRQYDRWEANWDGEIHATREVCDEQVKLAHAAGFEAMSATLTRLDNKEGES